MKRIIVSSLGVRTLVVAIALVLSASSANAQLTPSEVACRATIAKWMGKYVQAAQKVVVTCHKLRGVGKIAATEDCNDLAVADSSTKVGSLAADVVEMVRAACDSVPTVIAEFGRCPTPFENVDDSVGGSGIDDATELAACLVAHANDLVQKTAEKVLGSPTTPLPADLAKCHGALAKSYTKYTNTVIKTRTKCQTASDKAGGALGFGCVLDDGDGKVTAALEKGARAIGGGCKSLSSGGAESRAAYQAYPRSLPDLDSCASDVPGLVSCALEKASTVGTGMAAMMWELKGICPEKGSYVVVPLATGTELDVGWTGLAHDRDPVIGYRAAQISMSCDADCTNCSSTAVTPSPDACRCSGSITTTCSTDTDCGSDAPCTCYFGPPSVHVSSGQPSCLVSVINGPMSGGLDPQSGDLTLDIPLNHKIHISTFATPCPTCVAGTCNGGARSGLACAVDATDATFGTVSYDCPPSPIANISGVGVSTFLHYTTGSVSLPFGTQCDPPHADLQCACGACSVDPSVACNANADCADLGLGVCSLGNGVSRLPNACNDGFCSPDLEPGEGTCLAGPVDRFCDGFLSSTGAGIVPCGTDSDCEAMNSHCPDGNCGKCSSAKNRNCFLNPIEATGTLGETIVGVGCLGATNSAAVNGAVGLPGAYRGRQNLGIDLLCSDGLTEFAPPGGSNCP